MSCQQGGNNRQFTVGYDGVAVGFEKGPPQAIFFLGADVASKNTISLGNQFFHQFFQHEYHFINFRWFHLYRFGFFWGFVGCFWAFKGSFGIFWAL